MTYMDKVFNLKNMTQDNINNYELNNFLKYP